VTRLRCLEPGIYTDDKGGMHIDVPELLEAKGYDDTPANRETLTKAALDMVREMGLPVSIVDTPPARRKGKQWRNYS